VSSRKRLKKSGDDTELQIVRRRKRAHLAMLVLLTVGSLAVVAFLIHHWKHTGAPASPTPATRQIAALPVAKAGFEILSGRWQRPDGGYVVEIKKIDAEGKMAAAYFNPRPIQISQAEAALEGTTVKVFIELRDVNYPGATYHLTYDAATDQLRGVYFQPALQQSFDVFFTRMK
jgi:hypothetical protein